jgi:hypothetical protein
MTGENVFDIESGDDYLVGGDTATLRAAFTRSNYGANFALSLNANDSYDAFWTTDRIYVSEASLWAKVLNNKIGVKAGYFADFDYFTPVGAWSLAGGPSSNAIQLTAYPIEGLQIDVRTKNLQTGNTSNPPTWYKEMEWVRNIDAGVKYVNPNFTFFVALDDDYSLDSQLSPTSPFATRTNHYQTDAFGYFAWTGTPKLTVGVEAKFLDLTSERQIGTEDVGLGIVTNVNASYSFTDALSARIWILLGQAAIGGPGIAAIPLLENDDGFTVGADVEVTYKLNDALSFSLRPIFQILNTNKADVFDFGLRPKVAWTIAPFPYAATINFSYFLKMFGDDGTATGAYAFNNNEALNHTIAVTFGWTF